MQYQPRTSNRQHLRTSQFSNRPLHRSQCQAPRQNSKKKYIEVCSKKQQPTNLTTSSITLPVDFKLQSEFPSDTISCHNLARSQMQIVATPSLILIPTFQSRYQDRGRSLPAKTIVVQQVVTHLPVNMSYLGPTTVALDYPRSLPIQSVTPQKRTIISNPIRQPAMPIRMFSHSPAPANRPHPLKLQRRPQIFSNTQNYLPPPQFHHPQIQQIPPRHIISQRNGSQVQIQIQNRPQQPRPSLLLSNQRYMECQVKLSEIQVKTKYNEIKVQSWRAEPEPKKSNYNSLVVTQEDKEGNFKENLELRPKEPVCDRIRNFTECSQIRINNNQVLKPKKNFTFV